MEDKKENLKQFEELKDNVQFGVPKGYFDEFPEKIKQRISEEEITAKVSVFRQLRPQLALVASFAALFILAYAVFSIIDSDKNQFLLSEHEIIRSLESDIFEIEESELAVALASNDDVELLSEYNLTEEEIMEYLNDEGEDLGILISDF